MAPYSTPRISEIARNRRTMRRPEHTFQVRHEAFAICPFAIVPVLPGDTMKRLLWQARAVADPIRSPLVGWWLEYYWFYVKHRDLAERDTLTAMMLNPGQDVTGIDDTVSDVAFYHAGAVNNINWTKLCYIRCIEEYFRNDGEAWNVQMIGSYAAARINGNGWTDSLITDTQNLSKDVDVEGTDANTTIQASEVERAMRAWEYLRMQNLTTQSYEEFLMTYGVKMEVVERDRPELLRYSRSWQYPVNTVEPTTGVPSSSVSWVVQERADKDRYFREPGFIIGLTVARPKVYLKNLVGSGAALLNDAYAWLPAVLGEHQEARMKKVTSASNPITSVGVDYWVDVADLFVYGDEFKNFALTDTAGALVNVPNYNTGKRYLSQAEARSLFVDNTGVKTFIRQDGVANIEIAGTVRDITPSANIS